MRLLIGKSILKREFGKGIAEDDREVLRRAMKSQLLVAIKGEGLPARSRLLKGYGTSARGPRRIVCLLMVDDDDYLLLFYRPKGDDVGDNITIKSPAFQGALGKYMSLLKNDILKGDVEKVVLY